MKALPVVCALPHKGCVNKNVQTRSSRNPALPWRTGATSLRGIDSVRVGGRTEHAHDSSSRQARGGAREHSPPAELHRRRACGVRDRRDDLRHLLLARRLVLFFRFLDLPTCPLGPLTGVAPVHLACYTKNTRVEISGAVGGPTCLRPQATS